MSRGQKKSTSSKSKQGRKKSASKQQQLEEWTTICAEILKSIMEKTDAEAFLEPVDWKALGLHDYPDLIKQPMDLGTIKDRLDRHKYKTPDTFAEHVRLVWANAMAYNQPGSGIYQVADHFAKYFEKRYAKASMQLEEILSASASAKSASGTSGKSAKRKRGTGKTSQSGNECSPADREKFSTLIHQLPEEILTYVVTKIQEDCPEALNFEADEDELEIEVNNIRSSTLLYLIKYAEKSLDSKKRKK